MTTLNEANMQAIPASLRAKLDRDYLEVIPTRTVAERIRHVPAGSWIGISCSPKDGIEPTLDLVDRLNATYGRQSYKTAPHIAARVVRDRAHLAEIISRLRDAGVRAVLVPGGDSKVPVGDYCCALDLLRDMAEIGHDFEYVGVAAHPEGHPLASRDDLLKSLLDKQQFATYFVTQLCFDPATITGWLHEIRQAGVNMHAWLGLPGVLETHKLMVLSLKIGVGQSARMLTSRKGLARELLNGPAYRPDLLFDRLLPAIEDPGLGVHGFHLFSFNNVEATERWRIETLDKLPETEYLEP